MTWREFGNMLCECTAEEERAGVAALTELGDADEILCARWNMVDEIAGQALIRKALREGVRFDLTQTAELLNVSGDFAEVEIIAKLQDYSSPEGICEVYACLQRKETKALHLRRALDKGVRFPAKDVAEMMNKDLPEELRERLLRANSTPYTNENLNDIRDFVPEADIIRLKSQLYHKEHPKERTVPIYDRDSGEFMALEDYRQKRAREEAEAAALAALLSGAYEAEPEPAPRKTKKVKKKKKGFFAKATKFVGMYVIGGFLREALFGKKNRHGR